MRKQNFCYLLLFIFFFLQSGCFTLLSGALIRCGDGTVDRGEECDDGNNQDGDGCSAACVIELCGDGVTSVGEACDDGNTTSGDGCRADCLGEEVCGDTLLDVGEECDDGNNEDGDGCDSDCIPSRVVAITAGGFHTCALTRTGTVRCWGSSETGQLGYGNTINIGDDETPALAGDVPVLLASEINAGITVTQISAGNLHTCALLSTGSVRCWGQGISGQLGYGNTQTIGDDETPASEGDVPVLLASEINEGITVTQISAGGHHTCAILSTGNMRCWGRGGDGELGYGDTFNIGDNEIPALKGDVPVLLPSEIDAGITITQISAGGNHTCALLSSGRARCWGRGNKGELGYGDTEKVGDDEAPSSKGDIFFDSTVSQIDAGDNHTCVVLSSNVARCFGNGSFGRLGHGNTENIGDDETAQVNVPVGSTVERVSAGGAHTCALLPTGAVRCFGSGFLGQLGYGNTEDVGDDETPQDQGDVPIGGFVETISAGGNHTCALLSTGAVRCFGFGFDGRLGYGNPDNIGDDELPEEAGDVPVF